MILKDKYNVFFDVFRIIVGFILLIPIILSIIPLSACYMVKKDNKVSEVL